MGFATGADFGPTDDESGPELLFGKMPVGWVVRREAGTGGFAGTGGRDGETIGGRLDCPPRCSTFDCPEMTGMVPEGARIGGIGPAAGGGGVPIIALRGGVIIGGRAPLPDFGFAPDSAERIAASRASWGVNAVGVGLVAKCT